MCGRCQFTASCPATCIKHCIGQSTQHRPLQHPSTHQGGAPGVTGHRHRLEGSTQQTPLFGRAPVGSRHSHVAAAHLCMKLADDHTAAPPCAPGLLRPCMSLTPCQPAQPEAACQFRAPFDPGAVRHHHASVVWAPAGLQYSLRAALAASHPPLASCLAGWAHPGSHTPAQAQPAAAALAAILLGRMLTPAAGCAHSGLTVLAGVLGPTPRPGTLPLHREAPMYAWVTQSTEAAWHVIMVCCHPCA